MCKNKGECGHKRFTIEEMTVLGSSKYFPSLSLSTDETLSFSLPGAGSWEETYCKLCVVSLCLVPCSKTSRECCPDLPPPWSQICPLHHLHPDLTSTTAGPTGSQHPVWSCRPAQETTCWQQSQTATTRTWKSILGSK